MALVLPPSASKQLVSEHPLGTLAVDKVTLLLACPWALLPTVTGSQGTPSFAVRNANN
jgi:hypothetical protein